MPLIMKNHCSMRLSTVLSVGIKEVESLSCNICNAGFNGISACNNTVNCNKNSACFSNVSEKGTANFYLMRIKRSLCAKGVDVPVPDHPQQYPFDAITKLIFSLSNDIPALFFSIFSCSPSCRRRVQPLLLS